MDCCPHCQRKLLSKASSRCNWCGEVIEDASYQQTAATEREAYFKHEAERDAISLARCENINTWDYGIGSQVFRPSMWRKPIPKSLDALANGAVPNPQGTSNPAAYSTPPGLPSAPAPRFGTPLTSEPAAESTDGNLVRPWYADDTKSESNRFSMRTTETPAPQDHIDNLTDEDPTQNRTGRFQHLEIDQK